MFSRFFARLRLKRHARADLSLTPEAAEAARSAGFAMLFEDLLRERSSERMWRNFRRVAISFSMLTVFAIYVGFYVSNLGYHIIPSENIVAVVKITGTIDDESRTASAAAVIPALTKAFHKPNVKAIVLLIDSGGGKPAESDRIISALEHLKKSTGKEVVAVIGNTGASAAYMIAVHADKVYASRYSLVGSVGAILSTWDVHKVFQKFDVQRKVYASGRLKGMLDPFVEGTPEADAKAQTLVSSMGKTFADEVQRVRGSRLKTNVDYWTGEVWQGTQALEIGLIDGLGTLDSVVQSNWDLKYYDFGPTKSGGGISLPFASFFDSAADSLVEAVMSRLGPSVH